jgi:hypothetical protein
MNVTKIPRILVKKMTTTMNGNHKKMKKQKNVVINVPTKMNIKKRVKANAK